MMMVSSKSVSIQTLLFIKLVVALIPIQLYAFSTMELVGNESIRRLRVQSISKIGEVDLVALSLKLNSVEVRRTSGVPIGSCGRRLGMLNIPNQRLVLVPPPYFQSQLPLLVSSTWLLHEGIEATGYFDENYGLSVGIAWLAQRRAEDLSWLLQSDLMSQATNPLQEVGPCSSRLIQIAGGGSTGIGGGGDPWAVQIKLELMDLAFTTFLNSTMPDGEKDRRLFVRTLAQILTLPLEAADFDPSMTTDKRELTILSHEIKQHPVKFERTAQGKLIARYPFMDLNSQPALRSTITTTILIQLYREDNRLIMQDALTPIMNELKARGLNIPNGNQ